MIKNIEIYSADLMSEDNRVVDIWTLPSQNDLEISVRVLIKFFGSEAEELFDTKIITGVCAQKYLNGNIGVPYGGRVFFYDKFIKNETLSDFVRRIKACEGADISETINNLRLIMEWDFEGM